MPCLSLKLAIGSLTALTVVLVAAVCLGITLTVSLAAIRDMGKDTALALANGASTGMKAELGAPISAAQYAADEATAAGLVPPGALPAANATLVAQAAADLSRHTLFPVRGSVDEITVFFVDGSSAKSQVTRSTNTVATDFAIADTPAVSLNFTRTDAGQSQVPALRIHQPSTSCYRISPQPSRAGARSSARSPACRMSSRSARQRSCC